MCGITKCCCCIDLEVGAQIISIVSLVIPLAETSYCAWSAAVLPITEIKQITVLVALGVLALFEVFCACLLVHGLFQKRPNCTVPWLVLAWVKSVILLILSGFGIAVLILQGQQTEPQPTTETIDSSNLLNTTTAAPPDEMLSSWQQGVYIAWVVVCSIQAFLLMYFACVVNSRRRKFMADDYSYYGPVRSDSIVRNVYVPLTQPLPS